MKNRLTDAYMGTADSYSRQSLKEFKQLANNSSPKKYGELIRNRRPKKIRK